MAQVNVKRVVALTPDQAFAIAADVANYPRFIPGLAAARIEGTSTQSGSVKRFAATLDIAAGPLGTQNFTCSVEADAAARQVTATSQDGPLKALTCVWTFAPLPGTRCTATVNIDYEFKSKLFQLGASALMDKAVARVMDAFERRGRELYPMSAIPNI
jgi:coenzyme Q-binding protein COQ10